MPTRDELIAAQEPMAFFSHDSNAAYDVKCQRLIHRRGWDGYGRWWRLCEYLAATKGHRIAFETEEDAIILAGVLGFGQSGAFDEYMAIDDCKSFVSELLDIGLIDRDEDGFLTNLRMLENALYFGRQRTNGRKGGRPRKNKNDGNSAGQEVQTHDYQTR